LRSPRARRPPDRTRGGVRRLSTVVAGEAELVAMFGVQNREHPRGKFSHM